MKEFMKEENGAYVDNETARNLSPENRALWDEANDCYNEISWIISSDDANEYRGKVSDSAVTVAAYLLTKCFAYPEPAKVPFEMFTEPDIAGNILAAARRHHIDRLWRMLRSLTGKHPYNVFCLTVGLRIISNEDSTPQGIAGLAAGLLQIRTGDRIADYCSGNGNFAFFLHDRHPEATVNGYEPDPDLTAAENGREEMSGTGSRTENLDVFSLVTGDAEKPEFDKIFSHYPLGQRLRELGEGKKYLEILSERIPAMSRVTSSDWLYNLLITDTLSPGGRAVAIMTNGAAVNGIDMPVRKYFAENGLIECVISLPPKIFPGSNGSTVMTVFSRGNRSVRLVDASKQYRAGRRINEIGDQEAETILAAAAADGEISMTVSLEELRENDYVLNTGRYAHDGRKVQDGAAFETVIRRITRGAPLNAKELDKISSSEPTDMQYLMLANIHNGLIDSELPYLSEIDPKNEKYCLRDRCLLLSKNGYPYKVAVAKVHDGQKIMANGNLYIIELDEEKVSPWYLAAWFGSKQGITALKSITVGATVPNIGVEQLKKLIIPLPAPEQQEKIAERYRKLKDEITALQCRLEEACEELTQVFEEEGGDPDRQKGC